MYSFYISMPSSVFKKKVYSCFKMFILQKQHTLLPGVFLFQYLISILLLHVISESVPGCKNEVSEVSDWYKSNYSNRMTCTNNTDPDQFHTLANDDRVVTMQNEENVFITKTYLYNIYPIKPHFYIVKLGFTGVNIIFLISAQEP